MSRNYDALIRRASHADGDRVARMNHVVDAIWDALSGDGVSWVGFYTPGADPEHLVLGPRRDKPACSPLGMHGACGQAFRHARPLVVRDVAELGPNYIACDPRDRSEVVVPAFEADGQCWGVLDLDSFEVGAFDEADATGLEGVLVAAGLSVRATARRPH